MLGRVEVREADVRAHWHQGQERVELQVLLGNDVAASRSHGPRSGRWIERYDRIAHRPPGGIDDAHAKWCSGERRRCTGEGQRKKEYTQHGLELSPQR